MKSEDVNGIPFKDHIESMKFREQELRDKAEILIAKSEAIMKERFELQGFLDQIERKSRSVEEKLRSLVQ